MGGREYHYDTHTCFLIREQVLVEGTLVRPLPREPTTLDCEENVVVAVEHDTQLHGKVPACVRAHQVVERLALQPHNAACGSEHNVAARHWSEGSPLRVGYGEPLTVGHEELVGGAEDSLTPDKQPVHNCDLHTTVPPLAGRTLLGTYPSESVGCLA